MQVNTQRVLIHSSAAQNSGAVVYWMSRDQRVEDNWALLYAAQLAQQSHQPLAVVFCYWPEFPDATKRVLKFMLEGLQQVEQSLQQKSIPFYFLKTKSPTSEIATWAKAHGVTTIVSDSSPLKFAKNWKDELKTLFAGSIYEVDAHNIVPVWVASPKQEFSARTIRPKITKQLDTYLTHFPELPANTIAWPHPVPPINWDKQIDQVPDDTLPEITWIKSGENTAIKALHSFCKTKLLEYATARNQPTIDGQSDLSPYLHFGQLSAQRVALEVQAAHRADPELREGADAFLEELIVRRELADNFCWYNPKYDTPAGFPAWAQKTLSAHALDPRDHTYSIEDLAAARTHDELWNACQTELKIKAKLHGYLRMYWGKKILEWTTSPEQAMAFAIYLNDTYSLDGRDPNGYTGIAWCMGGVHDRPWFDRPIFGTIRYMSQASTGRKVKEKVYVEQINGLKRTF